MPKKGLADITAKMPTSNRNTELEKPIVGGKKDKTLVTNAHTHSHKGKVINSCPHQES